MPQLTRSLPKYRHHKASGQAVVTLNGTDVYLGPFGTKVSKTEYDRVVGEWLAAGRQWADDSDLTVTEMLARYWPFAKQHYRKDGEPTGELDNMRYAAKLLKTLYGHTAAAKFGPLALKALQAHMVDDGLSRGVINGRIGRINPTGDHGRIYVVGNALEKQAAQGIARRFGIFVHTNAREESRTEGFWCRSSTSETAG